MAELLVIVRDGVEVAAVPLGPEPLEVGAAPGNGLQLRGSDIRPFHLVLRRSPRGGWRAVARGGTLRTDGKPDAVEVFLGPGARLAVGPYRLAVTSDRASCGRDAGGELPERTRPLGQPAAPPGPARLALRWAGAQGVPRCRVLEPGTTVLGRAPDCDIVLEDPSVSARHAHVTVGDDGPLLEDLGSLNGSRVDGHRVWLAALEPRRVIRLGAVDLEVVAAAADGTAPSRRPRPVFPPGLRPALEILRLAAASREPCVLLGETGTGKEVLARHLHELGAPPGAPFVAINAGALPRELIESTLFGHRRGAFTGAVANLRGAFERAAGGTLFLDEVGDLPLDLQVKLLRVLEDGEVLAVGAERPVEVDVRVVAATNADLPDALRAGRFRLDLWHRLAVFVVRVPPLRERPGDVPALATTLLEAMPGRAGRWLTEAALQVLRDQPWPGNVRELRNVLVRAAARTAGRRLSVPGVRAALAEVAALSRRRWGAVPKPDDPEAILDACAGNIAAAARATGMARTSFRDLLTTRRRGPARRAADGAAKG